MNRKNQQSVRSGPLIALGIAFAFLAWMYRAEMVSFWASLTGEKPLSSAISSTTISEGYDAWNKSTERHITRIRTSLYRELPVQAPEDLTREPETGQDPYPEVEQDTAMVVPAIEGVSRVAGGDWTIRLNGQRYRAGDVVIGADQNRYLVVTMNYQVAWLLCLQKHEDVTWRGEDGAYTITSGAGERSVLVRNFPQTLKVRSFPEVALEIPGAPLLGEGRRYETGQGIYVVELIRKPWFLVGELNHAGEVVRRLVGYAF